MGPLYTKLIAATASEALHVLDALLYHQSEVSSGGTTQTEAAIPDHVFALCTLLASIRAAHSGSEAPAALQLRQAVRLPPSNR
jgi:hypothetical protein